MLDAETALGEDSQTRYRNSERDLFVAGNRSRNDKAKNVALSVKDAATVGLALETQAHKGCKARCSRLAAAFGVDAAETSLKEVKDV